MVAKRETSQLCTGGHQQGMFVKLGEKLSEDKQNNPEATVNYQLYAGDSIPLIVTIVTPLMKRVHKDIKQAAELVFVDATCNTEGLTTSRVFFEGDVILILTLIP